MTRAKEWIEALDRNKTVDSVSMGGISEGYEMAIQSLVVEIVRKLADREVPTNKTELAQMINSTRDKAVKVLDGIHGFSGAQVGAAGNLASIIWVRGLDSFQEVPDRIIKIKKGVQPYIITIESKIQ